MRGERRRTDPSSSHDFSTKKEAGVYRRVNLEPSAPAIAGGRTKNGSSLASKDEPAGTGKAMLPV